MGEAVFEEEIAFLEQTRRAAAVLCRTEYGNLHAGVMYRDGARASVLHLGWEDQLSRDWDWQRLWATPDVAPERLVAVAGVCRQIWRKFERDRTFPYALRFAGTSFDGAGRLVFGKGARGLTCATFILAVFQAVGVSLVMEDDWPIRTEEDLKFLDTLAAFASKEHLTILKNEVADGAARIHPDEVLGACACPLPANFQPTRAAADRVVAKLDAEVIDDE